ncbi:MAG: sprT domain-containing protein [Lentimicrobium sp.]|nr:sprT domain-containing protein [Lentimicrobium sp.]
MNKSKTLREALENYLPAGCADLVSGWFGSHQVILRITKSRRSKLGDFRGGNALKSPVISVNHNLNQYSFLVTLLHEMAHAEVFLSNKRRMVPHGQHWKRAYQAIALPFLEEGLLPEQVSKAFNNYLKNPSASSTTNLPLAVALRKYDPPKDLVLISELPTDALFSLPDGRVFKRGVQLRKRYRCECLNNKRIYLFSPLAEIIPVKINAQLNNAV